MMARSSKAPSIGRIQKRKTNILQISFSACNARPVHTDGAKTVHYCSARFCVFSKAVENASGQRSDFCFLRPRSSATISQRLDHYGERRRELATAWVIEVVA
jgi:hypothetical protein